MKPRVTQKAIKEAYPRVLSVGYCELQNLLRHEQPRAYTAGVYGWNADVYVVDGTAIATGYRSFGTKVPYELVERYESVAKYVRGLHLPYEETKERLHVLAREFVRDALEEV